MPQPRNSAVTEFHGRAIPRPWNSAGAQFRGRPMGSTRISTSEFSASFPGECMGVVLIVELGSPQSSFAREHMEPFPGNKRRMPIDALNPSVEFSSFSSLSFRTSLYERDLPIPAFSPLSFRFVPEFLSNPTSASPAGSPAM